MANATNDASTPNTIDWHHHTSIRSRYEYSVQYANLAQTPSRTFHVPAPALLSSSPPLAGNQSRPVPNVRGTGPPYGPERHPLRRHTTFCDDAQRAAHFCVVGMCASSPLVSHLRPGTTTPKNPWTYLLVISGDFAWLWPDMHTILAPRCHGVSGMHEILKDMTLNLSDDRDPTLLARHAVRSPPVEAKNTNA